MNLGQFIKTFNERVKYKYLRGEGYPHLKRGRFFNTEWKAEELTQYNLREYITIYTDIKFERKELIWASLHLMDDGPCPFNGYHNFIDSRIDEGIEEQNKKIEQFIISYRPIIKKTKNTIEHDQRILTVKSVPPFIHFHDFTEDGYLHEKTENGIFYICRIESYLKVTTTNKEAK